MRPFVIGGNWKLQINTIEKTTEILQEMSMSIDDLGPLRNSKIQVFLALPYTSLYLGKKLIGESILKLGAQNVHYDEQGPYTGEISITALKEFNVEYVLIGHSERRIIFKEKDENLNKKVHKILEHGLKPVLCIGETAEQRNSGDFQTILHNQLEKGLHGVNQEQAKKIIIAYEPVWAINNPLLNPEGGIQAATPKEAEDTHKIIREWFRLKYGEIAEQLTLQYGGSMKPSNAKALLQQPNIDGGLIGTASLSADTFTAIVKIAAKLQRENV